MAMEDPLTLPRKYKVQALRVLLNQEDKTAEYTISTQKLEQSSKNKAFCIEEQRPFSINFSWGDPKAEGSAAC